MKPSINWQIFFSAIAVAITFSLSAPAFTKNILVKSGSGNLFMKCLGTGSPAVIFISGYLDRGDSAWENPLSDKTTKTLFSQVSQFTTACNYDRPGTIKVEAGGVIF